MRAHQKHCPSSAGWTTFVDTSKVIAGVACVAALTACSGQIGPSKGDPNRFTGTGTTTGGNTGGTGGGSTTGTGTGGGMPGTDPGRVTVHRLNRVEYDNTVHDLLGTTLTPANDFPVDDRGGGFDNMADVLSLSPVQLSLYQSAASALVEQALTNPTQRSRLVTCDLVAQGATCARTVLTTFTPKAWRRPVTDAEITHLMNLVSVATSHGDDAEQGLKLALQSVLLSPNFVFRVELDPTPDSKTPHPLAPYELASRLSYFLWSTMPDDQLFAGAKDGTLVQPAKLASEVERMLQSPKARALVDNFGGQWLYIRMMDEVTPDPMLFSKFDDKLRAAMMSESQLLFNDVVTGAIPADQLLTANYTYANDRLAQHYGLPPLASATPTKVVLTGNTQRGGFLSHGSFLTGTSHTTRTSLVVRGKWVLNQLLCTVIPPPPGDVDTMAIDKVTTGTLRQRMEAHRTKPSCAACHGQMDPIGFGLENYDAIGAYRTMDGPDPVDSSGTLPGNRPFSGALELERLVAADAGYAECVVKNLYSYALGREPDTKTPGHMDPYVLKELAESFRQGGYNFRELVGRIAAAATFTSRRGDAP
jgi:hypothetical protein